MKIFIDFIGHLDLDFSMHLLFEKRLGWTLYRPAQTPDWASLGWIQGSYSWNTHPDWSHNPMKEKPISFEQFKDEDFDIIITTCWNNEEIMQKLIRQYHPKAIWIRHIANSLEKPMICKNVLRSTNIHIDDPSVRWVRFVPEHRAEYLPTDPSSKAKLIKSFFPFMLIYPEELSIFNYCRSALTEFDMLMYGGDSELGPEKHVRMPQAISECMFLWHTNPNGCFGYIPRPALACGVPLITRLDHYRNFQTMGEVLLQDEVNCIDIDPKHRSLDDSIKLIQEWSQPGIYQQKVEQTLNKFYQDVDFNAEAQSIQHWIGILPAGA